MTTGALERVIQRAGSRHRPDVECCDLCSEDLAAGHRHLLDTDHQELQCICPACTVLFNRDAASAGHYRLVPQRRLRLSGVAPADLRVPVGLAFFVQRTDGSVGAHYPSPAGPTRWEVDDPLWRSAVGSSPRLADLMPEVEALLVNTVRGRSEAWLVPIDDCFRLVGIVRQEWKGLSGGDRVWPAIEAFFEELRTKEE